MRIGLAFGVYLDSPGHVGLVRDCLASIDRLEGDFDKSVLLIENHVSLSIREEYVGVVGSRSKCLTIPNTENNLSKSWNLGLRVFGGCDYIFIGNIDIVFYPDCLRVLVEDMESRSDYIMTSPMPDDDAQFLAEIRSWCAWYGGFLVRPEFLEKTGGFDENFCPIYCEDADMNRRLWGLELKSCSIAKAKVKHVSQGTRKLSSDPDIENKATPVHSEAYYVRKWGGMPGSEKWLIPFNAPGWSPAKWERVK